MNLRQEDMLDSEASTLVRRFAPIIAGCSGSRPLADVACGSGRNALVFARLGYRVVCLDQDLSQMKPEFREFAELISLHALDLSKDPWPFGESSLGGIINVHFLLPSLLPLFATSLIDNAYLLLETVPGHGGNYLQLPQEGHINAALEKYFALEFYQEKKVGPPNAKSVTVKLLARRKRRNA